MEQNPLQCAVETRSREGAVVFQVPKQTVPAANIIHFQNMLFCNCHLHLVDLQIANASAMRIH